MTDSNIYEQTLDSMRRGGQITPPTVIKFKIPNAEQMLRYFLSEILKQREEELNWLPEYSEVSAWLDDNQGRGLFLYGDCGRGKSLIVRFAIPMILRYALRMVVNVYDAPSLLQNVDSAMAQRNIAIDDMGTESMLVDYGNKRDVVSEIFDAAEKTGKLLIVSTNLRKDQLIDRYGERIFERVISTTKRIEFTGKSLRK